jgi:hypothetical protein
MNVRSLFVSLIVGTIVLAGCATSTSNYSPPVASSIANTKQVASPFDSTWDKLVRQLSSDFFVINNIDKNSRLINISFSSQKPSDFVDCGRSMRTFKNARGEQTYNYNSADSTQFTMANDAGHVFHLQRTTRLEGRTNIYVAPEANGTLVIVNTKYVVNLTVNSTNVEGHPAGTQNLTWDFSTKQGYVDQGSNGVSCHATGAIERRILSLVGD